MSLPQMSAAQNAATIDLGWVIDLVVPLAETALVALGAALAGWLFARLGRWLGVEIDRQRSDTLHAAIERAIRYGVRAVAETARSRSRIDVESVLVAETAAYLETLVPDTLRHFGLDDAALDQLIRAHLSADTVELAKAGVS